MADTPEVLKRLEEIEQEFLAQPEDECTFEVERGRFWWLLRLTRALLESQGELLEEARQHACCKAPLNPCAACTAIARAEKVRKGEV